MSAYKVLSTLSEDPTLQGATQKVSAIRYFLALDMFYKKHSRECNTRNSEDKTIFVENVNAIVALEKKYTPNFFTPIADHQGDCAVGSNFYSVGVVSKSLTNPAKKYNYPQRGSNPLFEVQNGVLYEREDYFQNFDIYVSTNQLKCALVLWICRDRYDRIEDIYSTLKTQVDILFTEKLAKLLLPSQEDFLEATKDMEVSAGLTQATITPDDIQNLFSKNDATSSTNLTPEDDDLSLQIIYYGAPGTGKSNGIKQYFTKNNIDEKTQVIRTTFHPDSDYSTFVGAYKPTMTKKAVRNVAGDIVKESGVEVYEPSIVYTFVPQAFLKAYVAAWKNQEQNMFLVIEEINRGNCAQIFGDIFQLLDRNDNGESEYPIKADQDIQNYLAEVFADCDTLPENIKSGEELVLPSNLHIWATMNTSDQSLFPIDSAFKRRWDWVYVPIKYANGNWVIEIGDLRYSWVSFQKIVNKKVYEINHSEDKMLGDFFVKANDQDVITEKVLINKILFYLWNDVCKDGEGDIFKKDANTDLTFSDLYGEEGTKNLIEMMKYLEVEEITTNNANGNNTTNSGTNGGSDPKYIINGVETINSARQTVKRTIIKYVEEHPAISVDELRELWNEKTGRPLLETTYIQSPSDSRSRRDEITWDNNTKSVWVWMDWSGEAIKPFI